MHLELKWEKAYNELADHMANCPICQDLKTTENCEQGNQLADAEEKAFLDLGDYSW